LTDSWNKSLSEQHPPLSGHEALVEANRCLYCYDAPCTHACPTHIDIPKFIKKISTDNLTGSARTILESNLMGATCARVCPVQELCEGACVLNAEEKPIMIGRLQRYAMDHVYSRKIDVLPKPEVTGKRIAIIGAGPAGLSCAGEMARRGHSVTVYERRELGGGLSTYGIIVLREPVPVALEEVEMIARLGVTIERGIDIGSDVPVSDLLSKFEAVFIATGLGQSPALGIPGEEHILDGLEFIEQSKLDLASLKVGNRVLVIGAGNTAIDCATVAKRCAAEHVTMIYRRTDREMTAYAHEYDFVKQEGVEFEFLTQPVAVKTEGGKVIGLECVRMGLGARDSSGRPSPAPIAGSNFVIPGDQIIKAIGQQKPAIAALLGLETERGLILVNEVFETNVPGVYAGGDCIRVKGSASTVMAAQDGKLAAAAIHANLSEVRNG
jgi:glutamate synthase (NADPH/NADH) small chain